MSIIIEDGSNTSYISTLLASLYYVPIKQYDILLKNMPISNNFLYLQSLIKIKFVDELRDKKCIFSETINEIRNYMVLECNWEIDNNPYDDKDIIDFYNFLTHITSINQCFITLNIDKNCDNSKCVNSVNYSDDCVFLYIIKRNDNENSLDIWNVINNQWICQSIICLNKGHYYAIIRDGSKWNKFDDTKVPSIYEINLSDYKSSIMKECVLIIYRPFNKKMNI